MTGPEDSKKADLVPPEKMTNASEGYRVGVDATIAAIPIVGGPAATLSRHVIPSQRDKNIAAWRSDVTERTNDHGSRLDVVDADLGDVQEEVQAQGVRLDGVERAVERTSIDDSHFMGELEGYRTLINDGKVQTARQLLDTRFGDQASTDAHPLCVRARAKALMAYCAHFMGENDRAVILFEEAYELDPNNPKIVANRALGYLLADQPDTALKFAREALVDDPLNAPLAANFVHAHRVASADGDPLESLDITVRQTEEVQHAHVQWLRYRDAPSWREAAKRFRTRFPDKGSALAATAELDELVLKDQRSPHCLAASELQTASVAADVLRDEWKRAERGEAPIDEGDLATLHNAILGYIVADREQDGLDLAKSVIERAEAFPPLRRIIGVLSLQCGARDLLDRILQQRTPGDHDLRIERHLRNANIPAALAEIETAKGEVELRLNPSDETLEHCLRLMTGPGADRTAGFQQLASTTPNDIPSRLCVAQFAARAGATDIAAETVRAAAEMIDDETPYGQRVHVASVAHDLGEFECVLDLLAEHVDPTRASPERDLLSETFVQTVPRTKGVRFFRDMRRAGSANAQDHFNEGSFHFNRGSVNEALPRFRQALDLKPDNLGAFLAVHQTLCRSAKKSEADAMVRQIDPARMDGPPIYKLGLAQLLWGVERPEAFELAYRTVLANYDDPQVCLKYTGLFFLGMGSDRDLPLDNVSVVAKGAWVRLEREHDPALSFVVSEDPAPNGWHRSPSDPIAAGALGKAVGETFIHSTGVTSTTWRVAELKSRYLALFHEILDTFEDRFPGVSGFWKLTMRDDDVTPFIDQIRALGERTDGIIADYLQKRLPLGVVARMTGANAIAFATSVGSQDMQLMASIGFAEEGAAEAKIASAADTEKGVVLDAYTAWFLANSELLATAKTLFGRLIVPQSVVDEVSELLSRMEPADEPQKRAGWENGHVVVTEITVEEIQRDRARVERIRADIQRHCDIVGSEVDDATPSELIDLLPVVGPAFDAILVAARQDTTLFSVDLHLRSWAGQLLKVPAFGMKGFLDHPRGKLNYSETRRSEIIVKMAIAGHNHLPITARTLLNVLDGDDDKLQRFQVVARYIGTSGAFVPSHIGVVVAFIDALSARLAGNLKAQRALSHLLRNIVRIDGADPVEVTEAILQSINPNAFVYDYIRQWRVGHFFSAPN